MEFFLSRYRNLTVLLVVIVAQLLLIAYQVKMGKDIPLIRVWAVTAVTPIEQTLEFVRRNTWGFVEDYFALVGTRRENDNLKRQVGQLMLENQYLNSELATAERARALAVFQKHSPSKTVAARVIGNGTGADSKVVFVDRGSTAGVESGMAVVTPYGIVGKVVAAYPTASLVLLVTDSNFSAGVISQKNRVRGTLKGEGHPGTVAVDYVQNEERVDVGEWFFTSGDDRIFPKGFPVGQATAVRKGRNTKEIYLAPSGFQTGLEEVLIVLAGVHEEIPDTDMAAPGYKLLPAPPDQPDRAARPTGAAPVLNTDADRLKQQYEQLGDTQHHPWGEPSPPPDLTKLQGLHPAPPPVTTTPGGTAPGSTPAGVTAKTTPPAGQQPAPNSTGQAKAPQTDARAPAPGTAAAVVKTKSAATADANPPAPPKPRIEGPLLVTDPADADPTDTDSRTARPARPVTAPVKLATQPETPKPQPGKPGSTGKPIATKPVTGDQQP